MHENLPITHLIAPAILCTIAIFTRAQFRGEAQFDSKNKNTTTRIEG